MTKLMDMWGKSLAIEPPRYRPLIYHMADVCIVSQAIWDLSLASSIKSEIQRYLKLNDGDARSWIGFLCGLHDIGKATPQFQAKSPEMKAILMSKDYRFTPSDKLHGVMTSYLVRRMLDDLPADLRTCVSFSLGGHHGIFADYDSLASIYPGDRGDKEWDGARSEILEEMKRLSGVSVSKRPSPEPCINGAFFTILSGLTSVADWLASSDSFFANVETDMPIDAYSAISRGCASQLLEQLNWRTANPVQLGRSFKDAFPHIAEPYPMQNEAISLTASLDANGIVLIEAPMGEGKTEAALYLAELWNEALGQEGFYIGLPTQATADQMFSRTVEFLSGKHNSANLALIHGHACLSKEYQKLRIRDYAPDEAVPNLSADEWFTHRKRGLISPYGIGTIDQALLSVLPTRHFFVRLFGLAGKVVIIDEVHSYDVYMSSLMGHLLTWLKALGTSVILLSATLPQHKRKELLFSYLGHGIDAEAQPYPRITWSIGAYEGVKNFPSACECSPGRSKEVLLKWVRDEPGALTELIRNAASTGGSVAVICNTVNKAQTTYLALKEDLSRNEVELDLFHARYPYGQRKERQDRVLDHFGKHERVVGNGRVLVATQVIEQSLDLDFDLMLTEIAPIDLVLQRMGRLHRHTRASRPKGLDRPVLYLIEPVPSADGLPEFGPSNFVYSEYVLLRSWMALQDKTKIVLPGDIESLVEEVYSGDMPALGGPLEARLRRTREEMERESERKKRNGEASTIPTPDYARPWDATRHLLEEEDPDAHMSLQARTRDSLPGVMLVCLYEGEAGPSLDKEGKHLIDLGAEPNESLLSNILDRAISINHPEIVQSMRGVPTPSGWKKSPILKNYKAIVFSKVLGSSEHSYICGRKEMLLGDELGMKLRSLED